MSKKTQVELKTELPDLVKSKGLVSTTKTTGDSMRTMLTDIIDSFTIPEDAAAISHLATGSVIPKGIIVMWSPLTSPSVDGDGGYGVPVGKLPKGWVVCDGSNGTPDMRDKFVMGAGLSHPVDVAKGHSGSITGSVKPHVLTLDEIPSHDHGLTRIRRHTNNNNQNPVSFFDQGYGGATDAVRTDFVGGGQAHTHDLDLTGSVFEPANYSLLFIMYKGLDYNPIEPITFSIKGVGTTTASDRATISVNWLDGGTGIYAANYFKVHAVNTSSGSDVTVNGFPYYAPDSNITKYYYYPPGAGSNDWRAVIPGLVSGQSYYVYVEGYNSLGLVSTTIASKVTVTTRGSVAAPAMYPPLDASMYPYTYGLFTYWSHNTNEDTELEYSTDVLFGTSTKVAGSYSYNRNRIEAYPRGLPVNTNHYYRTITVGTANGIPYKTWSYVGSYSKTVNYPIVTHYEHHWGGDSEIRAQMKVRGTVGSRIRVRIRADKWNGGGGWIDLKAGPDFTLIESSHRTIIDNKIDTGVDIWEIWELNNDNIDCVAYLSTNNYKNHTTLKVEAFDMGGTSLKGPRMDSEGIGTETDHSWVKGD